MNGMKKEKRSVCGNRLFILGNKDETTLKNLPIYSELLKRRNVLLLGNGLNDLDMVEGFDYDNLISVGFLGDSDGKKVEDFKSKYDVVILDDGSFSFVNEFMRIFS